MTLSLVRVVYAPDSRAVVLLTRRLPLLRVRPPRVRHRPPTTAASPGGSAAGCSSPGRAATSRAFCGSRVHRPERDAGRPTETRPRPARGPQLLSLAARARGASPASAPGCTARPSCGFTCSSATASCARSRALDLPPSRVGSLARRDRRRRRRRCRRPFRPRGGGKMSRKMSSMTAKRILVTGATGFIGGLLARRLLADGFEVRCLVREREAERGGRARGGGLRDRGRRPHRDAAGSPRRSRASGSPTSSST